jgi:glycosyltransferase involved in cell wall biosynthesis
MRVALVSAFPERPELPRGGVEAVTVTLARALRAHGGLDLHIVTVRPHLHRAETREWDGVTIHALPRRGRSTLTSAIGVDRRQVHRCLGELRPDLVHAHDTFGIMVRAFAAPRVLTIHGFIHGDTRVSGQRLARLRALAWRFVETRAWADFPHVISISPYVRERLTGIARGVIHDIDNPIDGEYFAIRPQAPEAPTVFSAAVISRRKNTLNLVEAVIRLAGRGIPARLRLAGAVVEPAYHQRVLALIARRNAGDRVTLLGPLDRQGIRDELARASVFALVSREENSPLGIEEAMAAGVPVVASNRCGMPYMVRDGVTGWLVDPEDPDDIANRLAHVLTAQGSREEMADRSRSVARDRFHPEAVAARTYDVYTRAVDGRRVSTL